MTTPPNQNTAASSFLPEDYVARKAESRANVFTLVLFALVLAAVVGAFLVTNRRWSDLRARQVTVNELYVAEGQKIEQLKSLESQRAQMMEKAEITAALVEKVPRWAMLGEIALRTPRDMRLDSINLKSVRIDQMKGAKAPPPAGVKSISGKAPAKGKEPAKGKAKAAAPAERPKVTAPRFDYSITISGAAEKNNDIADFLAGLKSSPVFDKVELTYIREAAEDGRDLRKFEVAATIRPASDTKALATSLRQLVADRQARLAGDAGTVTTEAGTGATPGATTSVTPGAGE